MQSKWTENGELHVLVSYFHALWTVLLMLNERLPTCRNSSFFRRHFLNNCARKSNSFEQNMTPWLKRCGVWLIINDFRQNLNSLLDIKKTYSDKLQLVVALQIKERGIQLGNLRRIHVWHRECERVHSLLSTHLRQNVWVLNWTPSYWAIIYTKVQLKVHSYTRMLSFHLDPDFRFERAPRGRAAADLCPRCGAAYGSRSCRGGVGRDGWRAAPACRAARAPPSLPRGSTRAAAHGARGAPAMLSAARIRVLIVYFFHNFVSHYSLVA